MTPDWKGIEQRDGVRWLRATRPIGFCMLGVGLIGSAIALLIGRPDIAIDGIVPTALGSITVIFDAVVRSHRKLPD